MGIAKIVDERIYLVPWSLWPRHFKVANIKRNSLWHEIIGLSFIKT